MSIFGRVLSGDIKVCIGEIAYTELSSATLGEHDVFAELSSATLGEHELFAELSSAALGEHEVFAERSRGEGLYSKLNSSSPCAATCISYIAPTTHTM